jgi:hypothetical protein
MTIQVLLDDNCTSEIVYTQGQSLQYPAIQVNSANANIALSSQSQYEWIIPNLDTTPSSSSTSSTSSGDFIPGVTSTVSNPQSYFNYTAGVNGLTIGAVPLEYFNNTDVTTKNLSAVINRANTYQIPTSGTLVVETTINAKQLGVCNNPYPIELVANPQADPRLVSSLIRNYFDVTNSQGIIMRVVTGFAITNQVIYALYIIYPSPANQNSPNSYIGTSYSASFVSLIPIAAVNQLTDEYTTLSIGYNSSGIITWFVNSVEKYIVPRVGFYPEPQYIVINYAGIASQLNIAGSYVTLGFAIAQFLDACLPGFDARPALIPLLSGVAYYSPYLTQAIFTPQLFTKKQADVANVLFGQGAVMNIRNQLVFIVN